MEICRRRTWTLWVLTFAVLGVVALVALRLPSVTQLKHFPAVEISREDTQPIITFQRKRPPSWSALPSISPYVPQAIIVSEDWSFYSHHGIDHAEIRKMFHEFLFDGGSLRGVSTITQQLARNVFLSPEKTITRKAREMILAIQIERAFSKEEIIEKYLNVVEFGRGIYGITHAAQYYFQKEPLYLTAKEAAFLAMLLPNPKKYSASFHQRKLTPYARKTIDQILLKMKMAGYLSERDFLVAAQEPLPFEEEEGFEKEETENRFSPQPSTSQFSI